MSCSLLDDCLMAGIQESIESLLVDTFTVQAFTMVSNGSGGQTQTWADETTGVAGFLEGSKDWSRELLTGEHQQEIRRWAITLTKGTTVDASRRLIQTHKNGVALSPTRTFKILSVIAGQSVDVAVNIEAVETPNVS